MPNVTFVNANGDSCTVTASEGLTVMDAARRNSIPGIQAGCGGGCACVTCHVYVDEAWRNTVGEPHVMEAAMLEFSTAPKPNSRLACQIRVRPELDGLRLYLPEIQD
jgi:2Fe-2S ferredoxin